MQGVSDTPNLFPNLTRWFDSKSGKLIVNLLIIGLILLALILPPISLVERLQTGGYTSIPSTGGSVVDPDGTQVIVPQEGLQDATGTAGKAVRLQVSSVPRESFVAGEAGRDLVAAAEQLPANRVIPRSPLYQVTSRGDAPSQVVLRVPIPNDSEPYDTLDLYAYDGEPATWHQVPSQVVVADDVMEARLDYLPAAFMVMQTKMQPPRASAQASAISPLPEEGKGALVEVNPVGLMLGDGGDIQGSLQGLPADATSAFAVVPTLRNWEDSGVVRTDLIANMLVTDEQQQRHIDAIEQLVVGNLYAGINLDYRGIDANLSQDFVNFVGKLAERLHAQGKTVSVTVEEPRQVAVDTWETGPYHWQKLGAVVDTLRVPATSDPKAYTPDGQIHALLRWAVGQVDRNKIQLVFPGTSIEQSGNYYLPKSYSEALTPLIGQIQASTEVTPGATIDLKLIADRATSELVFDENVGAYTYRYRDDQGYERTVWLENAESLSHKLQLINQYHLQGATIQSLPAADPEIWNALTTFQQGQPAANRSQFAVSWQVEGPDGQVIELGDDALLSTSTHTWQVPDSPGAAFKVQAAIVEDGRPVSEAGEVAMVVATYTPIPTATPEPTATPTPRPTATPRPAAPAAPAQPANTNPAPAPAPVGPSRGSGAGFGYGVQAHMVDNGQANQVMNVTRNMGFNWVKQQIEWKRFEANQGSIDWGNMDEIVNAASAADVKLLFSVVNAPNWARGGAGDLSVGGPPADPNTFASFLGQIATKYCNTPLKAIEVWNEQNLHYEWGNMPIDPGAYMNLLKPAYRAIKNACPSMYVISGAMTPTGAPAPRAMDDFTYLEGMYQNGLKNYADGVGAHPSGFNVPPSATWQDACAVIQRTGNSYPGPCNSPHHSWSFRSTMEGYRNIMAKYGDTNKRIWPTEFGWASGWTGAPGYEYANDNDLNEQAAWTVEAYNMMRNWGWVGPAFLWNLNFRVVANGTEKSQWGIVDPGWGPLPAYNALKAMSK